MKKVKKILVSEIKFNELNEERSAFDEKNKDVLKALARSIKEKGLLIPPVVYPNEASDKNEYPYTLVSGERRIKALKMLGIEEVLVEVIDSPSDFVTETEIMCTYNAHRNTPEANALEAKIASDAYDKKVAAMTEDEKKKFIDELKLQFQLDNYAKFNKLVTYEERKNFYNAYFRPRIEYIKIVTGLKMSNTSIKSMISDEEEETGDKKEKKEPKPWNEHKCFEKLKEASVVLNKLKGAIESGTRNESAKNKRIERCQKLLDEVNTFIRELGDPTWTNDEKEDKNMDPEKMNENGIDLEDL